MFWGGCRGSPLIRSPMRVFWREGGIFRSSTLNTRSTVDSTFSSLASSSFMRSWAVGHASPHVTSECDSRLVPGLTLFHTFFLKLLDEQRQSAPSHLPTQLLFGLGHTRRSHPLPRHPPPRLGPARLWMWITHHAHLCARLIWGLHALTGSSVWRKHRVSLKLWTRSA